MPTPVGTHMQRIPQSHIPDQDLHYDDLVWEAETFTPSDAGRRPLLRQKPAMGPLRFLLSGILLCPPSLLPTQPMILEYPFLSAWEIW